MVEAIIQEINLRKAYLQGEKVETFYFGGGTPSLLSKEELNAILNTIYQNFEVDPKAEITLEANPDDINKPHLEQWVKAGVNRLSIGIQSFKDEHLKWMNRTHNSAEALQCVQLANESGIHNISIDLIYGLPELTPEQWQENIQAAIELGVPHISAYCLTIEPNTNFGYQFKKGQLKPIDDEVAVEQFEVLMDELQNAGFDHYEISNFGKAGFYSKHNTSYWLDKPYLGIGPSAHSFNGKTRSWNIANNKKYVLGVESKELMMEEEFLNSSEQYNDYILTKLRTIWGVNTNEIQLKFGNAIAKYFEKSIHKQINNKLITLNSNNNFVLTQAGKFVADRVCMELFYTN